MGVARILVVYNLGIFPKIIGIPLWVVPIIRTIVFWGLYWGPLNLGNYHFALSMVGLVHLERLNPKP